MRPLFTLLGNQVRRAQLILLLVASLGILYVGLDVIGASTFRGSYEVTMKLRSTGGLMDGSMVNYRGHRVGRVTDVRLTEDGAEATLAIDNDVQVPIDTKALVLNLSAVGEQYVDLRPRVDHGPYLGDDSVIALADTSVPLPVSKLLTDLDQVLSHVSVRSLEIVIDELSTGIGSSSNEIQSILVNSERVLSALEETRPETIRILENAQITLRTLVDRGPQFLKFARSLRQVTVQLNRSDSDLRILIDAGLVTVDQISWLMEHDDGALAALLRGGDGLTQILAHRTAAIEAALLALPGAGFVLADIIRDGAVQGKLYTGAALACGYGTPVADALEDKPTRGTVDAACPSNSPHQPPRGADNAPRGY